MPLAFIKLGATQGRLLETLSHRPAVLGGFFNLSVGLGLPRGRKFNRAVELRLPLSAALTLGACADIARSEGEDLASQAAPCLRRPWAGAPTRMAP